MNLMAYWQVLKAQRTVLIVGTVVAVLLAALALVRVSPSGVTYRSPATYVAGTTLFVTQPGFPWGRTVLNEYVKAQGGGPNAQPVSKFADAGRLSYLAGLYSRLAAGDEVKKILDPTGKKSLRYQASQAVTSDGSVYPLINISAFDESPARAIALANRVAAALQTYVARNQSQGDVPTTTRVSLQTVNRADRADVYQGVKYTAPMMLFVLAMALTIFIAFVRYNVRLSKSSQTTDGPGILVAVGAAEASDDSVETNVVEPRRRKYAVPGASVETVGAGSDEVRAQVDADDTAGSPRVRGGTLRIERGREHPSVAGQTK